MSVSRRPWSVTILAGVYIAAGAAGFAYHLYGLIAARAVLPDLLLAELTEMVAMVSGVFILRGARWAQWLALAWIAFHVAISLGSVQKATIHGLLLMVIACCLFHRGARAYFRCAVSRRLIQREAPLCGAVVCVYQQTASAGVWQARAEGCCIEPTARLSVSAPPFPGAARLKAG